MSAPQKWHDRPWVLLTIWLVLWAAVGVYLRLHAMGIV